MKTLWQHRSVVSFASAFAMTGGADSSAGSAGKAGGATDAGAEAERGLFSEIVSEVISSPVNVFLVALIVVLVYKILKPRDRSPVEEPRKEPPPLRKDMTPADMRAYDGSGPDGRILVAVNGTVFDVTAGHRFYGPGGPYAAFAGKDASRGLATFNLTPPDKEYDDLSDLSPYEMDSVREWEEQFKERYKTVGRLLKPGEEPTNYSEEEEVESETPSGEKKND